MKYIFLFTFAVLASVSTLQAQDIRRTYPIDSCLWFMEPFQFRVLQTIPVGNNGQGNRVLFSNTGSPDLLIQGKGRFLIDLDSIPMGLVLENGTKGNMLLTVPEEIPGSENWPGGQPPFPLSLPGYLEKIEGNALEPPVGITILVDQIMYEDLTE
jgi:hypothetical protein